MNQTTNTTFSQKLYIISLALMPIVMMFYQYQQNIEHLLFGHILTFSAIVAVILLVIFFISRIILKTNFSAFVFSGFCFVCFFFLWGPFLYVFIQFRILIQTIGLWSILILPIALACGLSAFTTFLCLIGAKKSSKFAEWLKTVLSKNKAVIIVASAIILTLLIALAFVQIFGIFATGIIEALSAFVSFVISTVYVFTIAQTFLIHKIQDGSNARYTVPFIAVFLSVMLIMNTIPIVAFTVVQRTDDAFFMQQFNVTKPLEQQPNVYWFWLDGMLGFDAMSQFFGEDQAEFASELENRGFFVNRDAGLRIIFGTRDAVPILMSPHFYDRVISWETDPTYAESVPQNADILSNPGIRLSPNVEALRTAREMNETILAFNAAGYNTSTVSHTDIYFFPTVNQFYCMRDLNAPLLRTTRSIDENMELFRNITYEVNFLQIISRISPLSIPLGRTGLRDMRQTRHFVNRIVQENFERASIDMSIDFFADMGLSDNAQEHLAPHNLKANILVDIFNSTEPRFVTIMSGFHHNSQGWVFDELGNFDDENVRHNLSRYAPHHLFFNYVILNYVDLIINNDPDAVIVLQSDHGLVHTFNHLGIEGIMEYFSCTAEEALALRYSPMSAIRLPDITGGGGYLASETMQILSDPRNISRFLVNNFIGQNYDYVPYEFRQVFIGPRRDH